MNLNKDGYAVHGMDVVSYHDGGPPVAGSNAHVGEYQGAKYRFALAGSLSKFKKDPVRYVPAYGVAVCGAGRTACRIASELGKGTRVTVTLPIAPPG